MNDIPSSGHSSRASTKGLLNTLTPELFPLISSLFPRTDRSASLLTLATTCRHLHNIIIPYILYRDVCIEDEALAIPFLVKLKEEAMLTNEQASPSRSHHIHALSIYTDSASYYTDSFEINRDQTKKCLQELCLLVRCGGLRNLESLTIHLNSQLSEKDTEIGQDFWSAAHVGCPRLKQVVLTGIRQETFFLEQSGLSRCGLIGLGLEQSGCTEVSPNISTLVSYSNTLQYLDLRMRSAPIFEAHDGKDLLTLRLPHLHTLVLDGFDISQPDLVTSFWLHHSGLRKLVLGVDTQGQWFPHFDESMLPNLIALAGSFDHARIILPHASKRLKRLSLFNTLNAQAPYLLRAVTPDGILPSLQSLSIHLLTTGRDSRLADPEGNRWREDEMGNVTQASKRKASRWFDANYLTSLNKAAPNLEELELSGTSRETLKLLTNAFSQFVRLTNIVFSGPVNGRYAPFFESSAQWSQYRLWDLSYTSPVPYAPASFEEAARELAEGCPQLDTVCVRTRMGRWEKFTDLACRIIRGENSTVREIVMRKVGGMVIEREEEW